MGCRMISMASAGRAGFVVLAVSTSQAALACPFCDTGNGHLVHAGIFNASFGWDAMLVSSPFAVLLVVVAGVLGLVPGIARANGRPLVASGLFLGIGLGGFVDGILFHQILQLHGMLTGILPPTDLVSVEINMFWDGIFHAATWTMTALGLILLWRAVRRRDVVLSTQVVGSMLAGWGLFHLVEGVIDHQLLGLHHVVERFGLSGYDWAYLVLGAVFVATGARLVGAGLDPGVRGTVARSAAVP